MPATSQPSGQTSQLIPDETALEKLFRTHYAELLADAKARLTGFETAAPRVVSKAFHLAWNDRSSFKTPEELMAFLRSSVQHGAARELSRRAGLHRADHAISGTTHDEHHVPIPHETHEIGVDEAWERLKHTLRGGAPEAYRQRASAARHEAAEHVAALAKQRSWKGPVLGGAAALVVLSALFWYLDEKSEGSRVANALAAPDARNYESPGNRLINVTLDDGTVVNLGPESKITVPKLYGGKLRAVRVTGSANFKVAQVQKDPFRVLVGDVTILARGTEFTVRRYPEDSAVVLRVREGSVDVLVGEEVRNVATGRSLKVADGGLISEPSATEVEETSAWVDGRVIISERTLGYVLPRLKRFYGLDIKVVDTKLLDRPVFLSAPLNSPREAISSVEQSGGLKFTYVGDNMTFGDTVPSRPRRGR